MLNSFQKCISLWLIVSLCNSRNLFPLLLIKRGHRGTHLNQEHEDIPKVLRESCKGRAQESFPESYMCAGKFFAQGYPTCTVLSRMVPPGAKTYF